jgi:hypothetical protein
MSASVAKLLPDRAKILFATKQWMTPWNGPGDCPHGPDMLYDGGMTARCGAVNAVP